MNQSNPTSASCTWNIHGNVSLTGNNSGNRLILFESAGPHTGTAVYNIDGNINVGSASQLQLRSSTSGSTNSCSGAINVKGNIVLSGATNAITTSTGGLGTSTLTIGLVGTSAQTWTGIFPSAFPPANQTCSVVVNNSAGVVLGSAATVNAGVILTLTNGTLTTTTGNLLTIGAGAISGGSSSSFVSGPLAWNLASGSTTAQFFPIGKGTWYRGLTLTIMQDAATATTYTGEAFTGAPSVTTLAGGLNHVSPTSYCTFSKGAGANITTGLITLLYSESDGVTTAADLRIAEDDGAGNFVDLGGTGSGTPGGSITSATNFTSLGTFVLASASAANPLPIQLSSFTASGSTGNAVQLSWVTLSEVNNYGFIVERSASATSGYHAISALIAGNGTTSERHTYSFVDAAPMASEPYYRLKQTDLNGAVHYSEPVNLYGTTGVDVTAPAVFALSQNYPNPFNPTTQIRFTVEKSAQTTLELYNILGQKVMTLFNGVAEVGRYYTIRLDAGQLASGIYLYKLQSDKQTAVKRLMLVK